MSVTSSPTTHVVQKEFIVTCNANDKILILQRKSVEDFKAFARHNKGSSFLNLNNKKRELCFLLYDREVLLCIQRMRYIINCF